MNEAHTQEESVIPSEGRVVGNAGHLELRPIYLNTRSTPAVKDELLRIAKKERRSLSYVLHQVLAEWLENRQAAGENSQGREDGSGSGREAAR